MDELDSPTRVLAESACDLAAAGRLKEAQEIFEGLLAKSPNDSGLRSALGTVYQKLGLFSAARAAYDSALELDPKNPVALGNRGELRLKFGDREGFVDLAECVEADPNGKTAAGRRAKALVKAITMKAVEHLKGGGGAT